MKVTVLFFGATADTVGERQVEIELSDDVGSDSALNSIIGAYPELAQKHDPKNLHFSINQEYSSGNEVIKDGDELAVFTAVSGG